MTPSIMKLILLALSVMIFQVNAFWPVPKPKMCHSNEDCEPNEQCKRGGYEMMG